MKGHGKAKEGGWPPKDKVGASPLKSLNSNLILNSYGDTHNSRCVPEQQKGDLITRYHKCQRIGVRYDMVPQHRYKLRTKKGGRQNDLG